jgi:two-component system chemotaxis sensor kinase CheA
MSKNIFDSMWENATPTEKNRLLLLEMNGLVPVIVCVDDDEDALEIFSFNSKSLGIEAFTTTDTGIALEFISKNKSRILFIVSDFKMPKMDGFEFRDNLLGFASEIPFAILSVYVDREMALKGLEHKIDAFLNKPFKATDFQAFLKKEGEVRAQNLKEEYDMLKGFTDDATNLLENIEELCLELENNPNNADAIARIFGMVHTIKGSSGFFEPRNLHNYSHAFEDLLKDVQNGSISVTAGLVSVFLKGNDNLKVFVEEFKTGDHKNHDIPGMVKIFKNIPTDNSEQKAAPGEHVAEVVGGAKEHKASELRVSMTLLNEFMQTSGEMTVIRNMINKTVKSLEKQYQGDKEIGLLGELLDEMHKINSDVQSKITDIRRVPVNSLVKPLTRTVRDTARALNKEIDFVVEGDDLRLDNSIAEVLSKSLVHMMRNSVDHGIETPEKRTALGKSPKGKLLLRFSCQGENIIVDIQDDGAGINLEIIRAKVIEKGLRTAAAAQKMTQDELQYMIFDSGFSTAQNVTDFSGRGVGMSMVKDSVESMRGKIQIKSKQGVGSQFRLEIPIPKSVMITNCLFVSVADRAYGIPQDNILKVMEKNQLAASDYTELEGSEVIRFSNHLIPLYSVSKLMGIESRRAYENLIVIMKTDESVFALRVESVLDIEDAVIKPLSFNVLKGLEIYLGGTFLGDGSVGMVFNVDGVAKRIGVNNHVFSDQKKNTDTSDQAAANQRNVIVFNLQKQGHFCLEEKDVLRIERIEFDLVQQSGDSYVVPYRETVMTLIDIDQLISPKLKPSLIGDYNEIPLATVIIQDRGQYVGIVVKDIVDLKTAYGDLEKNMTKQFGLMGCYVIDKEVVSLIDLKDILGDKASLNLETAEETMGHLQAAA